jgi:ankyrin repeat protein
MIRTHRNAVIACLVFAVAIIGLAAAPQAHAQIGMTNANPQPLIGGNRNNTKAPSAPQAPALPGAQSNPDDVAKATNTDLPPTDALFDAVNRGDIATSRDAIARGADLNAHNVLGMTPLDLSVDLGRNDITFLLLSLRGSTPPADTMTQAAAAKATKPAGKPQLTKVASEHPHIAPRAQARPIPVSSPNQGKTLREFVSAGPGTPVPQDGFLGFGH